MWENSPFGELEGSGYVPQHNISQAVAHHLPTCPPSTGHWDMPELAAPRWRQPRFSLPGVVKAGSGEGQGERVMSAPLGGAPLSALQEGSLTLAGGGGGGRQSPEGPQAPDIPPNPGELRGSTWMGVPDSTQLPPPPSCLGPGKGPTRYPGERGTGDEALSSSCRCGSWGYFGGCSACSGPHSGSPQKSEKTAAVRTPLPPWQSSGLWLQRRGPHLRGGEREHA